MPAKKTKKKAKKKGGKMCECGSGKMSSKCCG
jgi:uncharacterized protein YchJ